MGAVAVRVHRGDRVASKGAVSLGVVAAVFDDAGRLLLTQRVDNDEWCLPGGRVDPGESVIESCLRELEEETGLRGAVTSLVGVNSDPHLLVEYDDGERLHSVSMIFEVAVEDRTLALHAGEVADARWVAEADLAALTLTGIDVDRVAYCFRDPTARPYLR